MSKRKGHGGKCERAFKEEYGWVCRTHGHAMPPPADVPYLVKEKPVQVRRLGRMAS